MTQTKPKILVVDDDADLADAIQLFFDLEGWDSESASSGNEAIRLLEQKSFSLVLSDIRMPNGTGVDLIKWMKTSRPSVPIILMTGFADISAPEASALGAVALIKKPFEAEVVMSTIRKFISWA